MCGKLHTFHEAAGPSTLLLSLRLPAIVLVALPPRLAFLSRHDDLDTAVRRCGCLCLHLAAVAPRAHHRSQLRAAQHRCQRRANRSQPPPLPPTTPLLETATRQPKASVHTPLPRRHTTLAVPRAVSRPQAVPRAPAPRTSTATGAAAARDILIFCG